MPVSDISEILRAYDCFVKCAGFYAFCRTVSVISQDAEVSVELRRIYRIVVPASEVLSDALSLSPEEEVF